MYSYKGKVIRVVDADTLDVELDLGFGASLKQRVRLARVDAPEVRGDERPEGLKATYFVEDRLQGVSAVIVTTTKERGKYGRYIAEIQLPDGENLSDLLLETGHAKEYKG